ncbi:MAG TPA: PAS domain S-box protein [Mesotoga sp.]|nr:PAS domain S-box protein [Mesotoga sp.]
MRNFDKPFGLENEVALQKKSDWENVFDSLPDPTWILDNNYRIIKFNRIAAEKLGKGIAGLKCYECVHKAETPPEYCPYTKLLVNGKEYTAEIYREAWGGHFLVTVTPLFDRKGRLIGGIHVARDITSRKQMEEALRKSQEIYYSIVESMSDGIVVLDRAFHYTHWNRAMEKLSKTPRYEAINRGKTAWEIFPHLAEYGVRELIQEAMQGSIAKKSNIPYRLKDGTCGFTSNIYMPLRNIDGEIRGVVGVVRDITEEKARQERLKETERNYRTLFDLANDAILTVKGSDLCCNDCNEKAPKLFGCTKEEIIGKPFQYFSPEYQRDGQRSTERTSTITAAALDGTPQIFEWQYRSVDGRLFDAEVSLNRIESEGDIYLLANLRDVSERKKAEKALRLSEKNYSTLVEATLTGLCVVQRGKIVFANKMFILVYS